MFKLIPIFAVLLCVAHSQRLTRLNDGSTILLTTTGGLSGGLSSGLSGGAFTLAGQPQIIRLAAAPRIQPIRIATAEPQIIRTTAPQIIRTVRPSIATTNIVNDEAPKPYAFSYATDDEAGTRTSREESSDESGAVRGSYSYTDPDGVYRTVEYIADADGYRATVRTNEPGTAKLDTDPADVTLEVEEPPAGLVERYATIRTQAIPQPQVSAVRVIQPRPQVVRVVQQQPRLQTIAIQRQQPQAFRLVPVNAADAQAGGRNVVFLNSLRS